MEILKGVALFGPVSLWWLILAHFAQILLCSVFNTEPNFVTLYMSRHHFGFLQYIVITVSGHWPGGVTEVCFNTQNSGLMNKSGRVMSAGDRGFNKKQESSCEQLVNGAGRQSNSDKYDSLFGITITSPIYIQFIYIYIHVQCLYMLIVHLPKHWFHMVLETGYKHLFHQMKSVSECS